MFFYSEFSTFFFLGGVWRGQEQDVYSSQVSKCKVLWCKPKAGHTSINIIHPCSETWWWQHRTQRTFSLSEPGHLLRIDRSMDGATYKGILQENLLQLSYKKGKQKQFKKKRWSSGQFKVQIWIPVRICGTVWKSQSRNTIWATWKTWSKSARKNRQNCKEHNRWLVGVMGFFFPLVPQANHFYLFKNGMYFVSICSYITSVMFSITYTVIPENTEDFLVSKNTNKHLLSGNFNNYMMMMMMFLNVHHPPVERITFERVY